MNTEEFIKRAKEIHKDRYSYSWVEYINSRSKVEIVCKKHGKFLQRANNHLGGQGCPSCNGTKKKSTEGFVEEAEKIHGDKYDYSSVKYEKAGKSVEILCGKHGEFYQTPRNHLKGYGCKKCAAERRTLSSEEFIKRAKRIHKNEYDYSLVEYVKSQKTILILCKKHGVFKQRPYSHLQGVGCPYCKTSKGENRIRNYLIENNIKFEPQKTFDDCVYKNKLRFDFYLIDYNILIEYDGEQHFKSLEVFGGDFEFKKRKVKDEIKNNYCKNKKIKLLRIKHGDVLEEKLKLWNG